MDNIFMQVEVPYIEDDDMDAGYETYPYYIEDADVAEKFRNLVEGVNEEDMDEGVMFMLDSEENERMSVKRFMKEYAEYIE